MPLTHRQIDSLPAPYAGARPCDPGPPFGLDSALTRIQRATVDLVAEKGYAEVDVTDVIARACVTDTYFHRHFRDVESCAIETFECITRRCEARLYRAYDVPGRWQDRLRFAAYAAARFIQENPREVRFSVVEFGRASELAKARLEHAVELYTDLIDDGRQELADPESLSRSVAQAAAGSILGLAVRDSPDAIRNAEQLVPEMMYIATRPYLGQEAALRELHREPPPESDGRKRLE